jgi:hypothetical protein
MKKVKNQPITGGKTEYSQGKRPIVPDAKDTSADEQRFIAEAPSPFKNKFQTGSMPTPGSPAGAKPGLEPRIRAGLSGNGAPAYPSGAAAGYAKLPNQSKQIGGRTGVASTARRAGAQNLSSVKRNASFYGE